MQRLAIALSLLVMLVAPATAAPAKVQYTGKAMGTYVTVWFWTDKEADAAKAAEQVFDEMKRLDAVMTTWTTTSEVSSARISVGRLCQRIESNTVTTLSLSAAKPAPCVPP